MKPFRREKYISLVLTFCLSINICLLLYSEISYASGLLFSNKSYSKNIIIQALIVSKESVLQLMEYERESLQAVKPDSSKDLSDKGNDKYLFVRIKNQGDKLAWGRLSYELKTLSSQEFDVPGLGPNSGWHYYIISLKSVYLNPTSDSVPQVTIVWEKLYTK
ncbi:MAG: hypothetical protein AMK70_03980 [Nitrospira bacterium SG8_35_1]|nr:MAG: hypothetical protein AMK70_03980 [Nitrospira bacterium SG8_35_1]